MWHVPTHRHECLKQPIPRHPELKFICELSTTKMHSVTEMKAHSSSGLRKKVRQMTHTKRGILPVKIYCLANKMSHGSFLRLQFSLHCQYRIVT